MLKAFHHASVVCSDLAAAKHFYMDVLGLSLGGETWREEKRSWKLELYLEDQYVLELFVNEGVAPHPTSPGETGLNHVSFLVENIGGCREALLDRGLAPSPLLLDPATGKQYCFIHDPDGQKLELYQA